MSIYGLFSSIFRVRYDRMKSNRINTVNVHIHDFTRNILIVHNRS